MKPETSTESQERPTALPSATLLGGKPLIPNEQFVIAQANQTLSTLVAYESQYKNDVPKDIQRRILELSDFIHQQLKAMGAPPVASSAFLSDIHAQLLARAEGWRNSPSDPHNIANAVQVALLEVANCINAAMKSDNAPSSATA